MGKGFRFIEVFDSNQSPQAEIIVHYQNFFDSMLMQQTLHFLQRRTFLNGYQLFLLGHDGRYRLISIRLETDITPGDNTDQIPRLHYGYARDTIRASQLDQLGNAGSALDGNRILYYPTFELLHPADLFRLLDDGHVFVDDPDTALLRQCYGQARLGHRIHGC